MMTIRQRPRATGANIPQRRCVVCRRQAGKAALVRIVRRPEGGVLVDLEGRCPGRGAYLCRECAAGAAPVVARIEYALRVRLSGEERRALEGALAQYGRGGPTEGQPPVMMMHSRGASAGRPAQGEGS